MKLPLILLTIFFVSFVSSTLSVYPIDSKEAIRDALKKLEQRGVGIEAKEKIDFRVGTVLKEELIVGTSIQPKDLVIIPLCKNETICGHNKNSAVFVPTNGDVYINHKAKLSIAAIKSPDKPYKVCIFEIEEVTTSLEKCKNIDPLNLPVTTQLSDNEIKKLRDEYLWQATWKNFTNTITSIFVPVITLLVLFSIIPFFAALGIYRRTKSFLKPFLLLARNGIAISIGYLIAIFVIPYTVANILNKIELSGWAFLLSLIAGFIASVKIIALWNETTIVSELKIGDQFDKKQQRDLLILESALLAGCVLLFIIILSALTY